MVRAVADVTVESALGRSRRAIAKLQWPAAT
jgi:hypothetical protein